MLERKDISFDSSLPGVKTAAYFFTNPAVKPFCVLQISHGMCEYIPRYAEFAGFLAARGIAVCGNDHIGHGETAAVPEQYGFFGETGGRRHVLADLATMNRLAREEFPGLPVILLGHSMGSFFARKYATMYPDTIDALIICGTAGRNPLAGAGIVLSSLIAKCFGVTHRSKLLRSVAFGSYLRRVKNPKTMYDWISRDEEVVRLYNEDPKCTFIFTANGFHELFSVLREVSGTQWAEQIPTELPVLMIQGQDDPVGAYGRGTQKVYEWLKQAGVSQLEYKIYPYMRHEVLNEIDKEQVYVDVLEFLKKVAAQAAAKSCNTGV